MAVNCIHTDIQVCATIVTLIQISFLMTNNEVMVKSAKAAYEQYPTIVINSKKVALHIRIQ